MKPFGRHFARNCFLQFASLVGFAVVGAFCIFADIAPTAFAAPDDGGGIDAIGLEPHAKKDGAIIYMDMRPIAEHSNLPPDAIYTNPKASPEDRAKDVLPRLTLDEKLALTGGTGSRCYPGVERLGLRAVHLQNASQGIGTQLEPASLAKQEKSTAFPCTLTLAATWDTALAKEYGRALGEECRALYVDILEGPGMNIYRHSEGARNFEYLGEDPFLTSRIAVNYVQGLQSINVIATIKHFVCNDQDFARHVANITVSERALHEIYLPPFAACITEADAGAVMNGNNAVNGWPGAANQPLVGGFLRGQLGFRGMVMSDFANCMFWPDRRNLILTSGQSMEMLHNNLFVEYFRQFISEHPEKRAEAEKQLDQMVYFNLYTLFKFGVYDRPSLDAAALKTIPAHKELARRTAEAGITLLKNADDILPIDPKKSQRLLVTGSAEALTAYVGHGSGSVVGYDHTDYPAGLKEIYGDKVTVSSTPSDDDIRKAGVVLFFISKKAGEGRDVPFAEPVVTEQVNHLAALNPNLVVIFSGGNGFAMPWLTKAKALVFAYLGGQENGNALANIISGKVNPSGRLPFTIEKTFSDSPGKDYNRTRDGKFEFGGGQADSRRIFKQFGQIEINYAEGIYVGYRWFEKKHIVPQFPFGFGLSYTTFQFGAPAVTSANLATNDSLTVSLPVTNTGRVTGAETVQLYVHPVSSAADRPEQELKGFAKISLRPGETRTVEIPVTRQSLAYWDESAHDWKVAPGSYDLRLGSSSVDICQTLRIHAD